MPSSARVAKQWPKLLFIALLAKLTRFPYPLLYVCPIYIYSYGSVQIFALFTSPADAHVSVSVTSVCWKASVDCFSESDDGYVTGYTARK